MDELVLYGDRRFVSPWVLSVWTALREKALPFRVEVFDLHAGEHRQGAFAAHNPTGKVPGLQHGDFWIGESLAILEYLEEAFPQAKRLLPEGARERARDRQVLSFLRTDLLEMRRCLPFEGVVGSERGPGLTEAAARDLGRLVRLVSTRPPLEGREPTLADYELAFALRRPIHHGVEVIADAQLFSEAIWQRPSVQSWVRHPSRG